MSGRKEISGGYCGGVPPLPIPNREVKPAGADGTAYSGRVGRRRLRGQSFRVDPFFCARTGGAPACGVIARGARGVRIVSGYAHQFKIHNS